MRLRNILLIVLLLNSTLIGCSKKDSDEVAIDGQSALEEQRKSVEKHIADPNTRMQVLANMDEAELIMRESTDEYHAYYARLQALSIDYDATREDFEDEALAYDARYATFLSEMLTINIAIKESVTPEEWAKLLNRKKSFLAN
jgi:hypothetical protein